MLSDRKFGVELELTHLDTSAFKTAARAFGMRVTSGDYDTRAEEVDSWVLKHDGSVHGMGLELVSPPLAGAVGLLKVRVMVSLVAQYGGAVDNSAGLHVHHDARDLDGARVRRLLKWWAKYEAVTTKFAAPHRAGNTYCQPSKPLVSRVPVNDSDVIDWARGSDRYRMLNLAAIGKHGTVEVRLPEATLDAGLVESWVVLGQRFVRKAVGGAEPGDLEAPTQPQVVGAALRLLSRNSHVATAQETEAFNRLSRRWHSSQPAAAEVA